MVSYVSYVYIVWERELIMEIATFLLLVDRLKNVL